MSLLAFVPTNTQKVRTAAIVALERMLEQENVSMEYVQANILLDTSGKRLAQQWIGLISIFQQRRHAISEHSYVVPQKYEVVVVLHVPTQLILRKQGKTLETLLKKRRMIWKFLPLRVLRRIYNLLSVMRTPQHVCMPTTKTLLSLDGAFYLRLLRIKTAEEQGLTLIPHKSDFLTCPLHALAVMLATQVSPSVALLDQLPELMTQDMESPDTGVPLLDILETEPGTLQVAVASTHVSPPEGTELSASRTDNRGMPSKVNMASKRT
ncbi:LOW QUALITY PROTEIN: hypothetical protein PHMEG_00032219 [Phytophthora megakarya]|uniref:Uncharacterized protein n=1 Tax=Phytophthora megakarya TaxID=4795 RepID=A0A225UWF0_9STRA|nr:LOW QUALITY PROTEIN: hypothetical protein PHMEG_00032219 [Phytophthora megakarya]